MAVLLAPAFLGCSSDAPPGATIAQERTLPLDSPLASLQKVALLRAGGSFSLAGYDQGFVHWMRLSPAGELIDQTSFELPKPVQGTNSPVFAVTKKNKPGDQLIAIWIADSATLPNGYDLVAVAKTAGAAQPGTPLVLRTLNDVTEPASVQLVAGAAASGDFGFVAWGVPSKNYRTEVNYYRLGADALAAGDPRKAFNLPVNEIPFWDCLATTNSGAGLGFSVVAPNDGNSDWHTFDIDENGFANGMIYPLDAEVTSCQIVGSPKSSGGYFIAFQAGNAIDLANFEPSINPNMSGTVTTHKSALPSAKFGGPLYLPDLVWASPAGPDVSVGVARASGPQVFRFSYNAMPHGGTVTLPSTNGKTGPVAAWVDPTAVYATYTDNVVASGKTTTKRYFLKIESPDQLP